MAFHLKYFLLAVGLFIVEMLIALFVTDGFIRPYVGDVLVVMLMYCFFRSLFTIRMLACAVLALLVAVIVEALQYLNFVAVLGLEHSVLARAVLGNSFSWKDLIAYGVGFFIVIFTERLLATAKLKRH